MISPDPADGYEPAAEDFDVEMNDVDDEFVNFEFETPFTGFRTYFPDSEAHDIDMQETTEELISNVLDNCIARDRRKRQWLDERREKLRAAAHKTYLTRRKVRTERLAARWTNDPSITTGRRLAAKTHAQARKFEGSLWLSQLQQPAGFLNRLSEGVMTTEDNDPRPTNIFHRLVRDRAPTDNLAITRFCTRTFRFVEAPVRINELWSLPGITPVAQACAAISNPTIFKWNRTSLPPHHTWYFEGHDYTDPAMCSHFHAKVAIAMQYHQRMQHRKVLLRSMYTSLANIRTAISTPLNGLQVLYPSQFPILAPLPKTQFPLPTPHPHLTTLPFKTPLSIYHALDHLSTERTRRHLYDSATTTDHTDTDTMSVDGLDGFPVVDGRVLSARNIWWQTGWVDLGKMMVEDFNAEDIATMWSVYEGLSVDSLKYLRTHLTTLSQEGGGWVETGRWNALKKAIGLKEKGRWEKKWRDDGKKKQDKQNQKGNGKKGANGHRKENGRAGKGRQQDSGGKHQGKHNNQQNGGGGGKGGRGGRDGGRGRGTGHGGRGGVQRNNTGGGNQGKGHHQNGQGGGGGGGRRGKGRGGGRGRGHG